MSYTTEYKLVKELHRLTRSGVLDWKRQMPPDVIDEGTNNQIFNFFATSFKGRKFGIFEQRTLSYNDDLDRHVWIQKPVLAVFTTAWELQTEIDEPEEVLYLFDTVRRKEANLDDLLTEVEAVETEEADDD